MDTKDYYSMYNNLRRDIFKIVAFTDCEDKITKIFKNYDDNLFENINCKEVEHNKTLISFKEAAEKIGWNPKSLYNRVSEYKKEFGKYPPFVHKVNGKGSMKIIPAKFHAWALNHKQPGKSSNCYKKEFGGMAA